MNEADTCRKLVVPKLQEAGWDDRPHAINEQRTFTDGRIVFVGGKARRGKQKRADYVLRYSPDFPIAVVEAKARYRHAADGLQQAKDYAEVLGLKFAYATNGAEIVEFDYTTGIERILDAFPGPGELWARQRAAEGLDDPVAAERLLLRTFRTAPSLCDIIRKSPSIVPSKRCFRGGSGSCSRSARARARPPSPSRSAGNCGRRAGTAGE